MAHARMAFLSLLEVQREPRKACPWEAVRTDQAVMRLGVEVTRNFL